MCIERSLYWVGSSLDDLRALPDAVIDFMGNALHRAQQSKQLSGSSLPGGFMGCSVLQVIADYSSNSRHMLYLVRDQDVIYVLHVSEKKSRQRINRPAHHFDTLHRRMKMVRVHHEQIRQKK